MYLGRALLILGLAGCAFGCTPISGYTYCRPITPDATKAGASDSSNFPLGVIGTYSYLATVGNGGLVQNANGYDINFTSDIGGTTTIPCEKDFYAATTGAVVFWVKQATLSHTSGIQFYVSYGNSGISTAQCASTSTWDSNFKSILHLPNGTTLTAVDSTGTGNGTLVNTPTAGTGQIDGGAVLVSASSQYVQVPQITALGGASKAVMSAWMKRTASGNNAIILTNDGSNIQLFGIAQGGFWGSGNIAFIAENGSTTWGLLALNNTSWHLIHMVYDGTQSTDATRLLGYVDGVKQTLDFSGHPGIPATILGSNSAINIGFAIGPANYSDATMDEFRITAGATRSADWITAEYNNQNSPSTFYTIGAQGPSGGFVANQSVIVVGP